MESAPLVQAVSLTLLGVLALVSFLLLKSDRSNPVHVSLGLLSWLALAGTAYWTQSRLYELRPDLFRVSETITSHVSASFLAGIWSLAALMMYLEDHERS